MKSVKSHGDIITFPWFVLIDSARKVWINEDEAPNWSVERVEVDWISAPSMLLHQKPKRFVKMGQICMVLIVKLYIHNKYVCGCQ